MISTRFEFSSDKLTTLAPYSEFVYFHKLILRRVIRPLGLVLLSPAGCGWGRKNYDLDLKYLSDSSRGDGDSEA